MGQHDKMVAIWAEMRDLSEQMDKLITKLATEIANQMLSAPESSESGTASTCGTIGRGKGGGDK